MAFTLGSHGSVGRDFLTDIQQISGQSWGYALLGSIIFNASNILLSASVSISGMSVAFPLGVGIALVLGVFINYLGTPKGDPLWLFTGVACVVLAIILNGMSANSVSSSKNSGKNTNKGILLAALAGICMSFFYRFVAESMDVENFISPQQGLSTPYTAFVIFSSGVLLSNFVFNTLIPYRYVGRMHMGAGDTVQLYSGKQGRFGRVIRIRSGSTYDSSPLGNFRMERIPRRNHKNKILSYFNVYILHPWTWNDSLFRFITFKI